MHRHYVQQEDASDIHSLYLLLIIMVNMPHHTRYPTNRGRQQSMPKYQAEARAILTDVTAAQDSLWANSQLPFQTAIMYKNVSVARAAELKQMYYSADWDAAWDKLAASGALAGRV